MSRKPSDHFTRFTSNSPHAAQNPSFESRSIPQAAPSSKIPSGGPQPGPAGETPAEKVARLRAAARAQRESQYSRTDRILARGRIWADFGHRAFAYGLIGLSGVSAVIGAFSLVSLISHNRRQKRAFVEREMDRLAEAQKAFLRGDASAEQLHLLEQERAGDEMAAKFKTAQEQKKKESAWSKLKGAVGLGPSTGDMGSETEAETIARQMRQNRKERILEEPVEGEVQWTAVQPSGIEGVGIDSKGRPVPASRMERVVNKVQNERRKGEEEVTARTGIKKGPLDVMADNISDAIVPRKSSSSWFGWGKSG